MKFDFDLRTESINQLVDNLPDSGVTVMVLKGLDAVVPGQWQNVTGFNNLITAVTGETNPKRIQAIAAKAQNLYNDPQTGFQRAMWLYQKVDSADRVLAAAAMANKVGGKIEFLSFLNNLVPKSEITQSLDLGLKITVEMLAYSLMHGLPDNGFAQFAQSLQSYASANMMRMFALISIDGLIPLGPNFMQLVSGNLDQTNAQQLEQNAVYQQVQNVIPGEDSTAKLNYIRQAISAVGQWITTFQTTHNLTPEIILANLKQVINFTDETSDYIAAFLDASTNYFEHTGTQSVAQHVIKAAVQSSHVPHQAIGTAPTGLLARARSKPRKDRNARVGQHRLGRESELTLETYLQQLDLSYETEAGAENIDYYLTPFGGATIILSPGYDEQLGDYVDIESILAVDVPELNKKTAKMLMELCDTAPFGGFYYDPNLAHIGFFYRLLAYMMDETTLAMVITAIGQVAEAESDNIVAHAGGESLLASTRVYPALDEYIAKGISRKKLWKALDRYLESSLKYDKDEAAYYRKDGSTNVYTHVYKADGFPVSFVESYGSIANEIDKLTREAALLMLEKNGSVPLGNFCYSREYDYIYFSHIIPGDAVDEAVLEFMMSQIGEFTDAWDDQLSAMTGGWREKDY